MIYEISHSFGEGFSTKKWAREVAGQREILSAYGGVKLEDIRGMRAPFLSIGGNKMFKMLHDFNFTYDSSMPVYENRPPSWPYTLDYKIFHDCMIPPCPTKSYPGKPYLVQKLSYLMIVKYVIYCLNCRRLGSTYGDVARFEWWSLLYG